MVFDCGFPKQIYLADLDRYALTPSLIHLKYYSFNFKLGLGLQQHH